MFNNINIPLNLNKVLVFILAPFLLFSLISCGGDDTKVVPYTTAEEYIKSQGFLGTVLIKKDGTEVLRKGFGYADKKAQQFNTASTRFRIGSLTKAFTALAIVQLKNADLLKYDDPISNFLPDLARGDEITIRHLLTHRSGLDEYVPFINENQSYTALELISLVKDRPLIFQPDSQFRYTNSNYLLLGYIIEIITGSDYASFIESNITNPLGMFNTEYGNSTIVGSEYAKGYQNTIQSKFAKFHDMSIPYAAGALSSNLNDMEIWANSFYDLTLITEQDKQDIFEGDYGFGWGITSMAGNNVYMHTGGIRGFSSVIVLFPDQNGVIILLSNIEDVHNQLRGIVLTLAQHEF